MSTIKEYLSSHHVFRIPAYQRGYKWGVANSDGMTDAQILVRDIVNVFRFNKSTEYFIQGITGYENSDSKSELVIIDGQQRTTTIFLLVSLLAHENRDFDKSLLFSDKGFKLHYDIRQSSSFVLEHYCAEGSFTEFDIDGKKIDTQDLFYFKNAVMSMEKALGNIDRKDLLEYLLDKVNLFLIIVNKEEAANVFTMMNGNKAFMTTDELIKSDFLSKTSDNPFIAINQKTISELSPEQLLNAINSEWETNAYRSRLAREWDTWIYWWNRDDVRRFYKCGKNPMGLLLESFSKLYATESFDYSNEKDKVAQVLQKFQTQFLTLEAGSKEHTIKLNFEKLRKLQNRFEDLYNNTLTYNLLGYLIQIQGSNNAMQSIVFFLKNHDEKVLKDYTKWMMAGLTDLQYFDSDIKPRIEACKTFKQRLSTDNLYEAGDLEKKAAYKYLYYLNVMASLDRNEKFGFFYQDVNDNRIKSMWEAHSLEHIWPKSREDEMEDNDDVSVHSIGNLVYLHRNDNSSLKDKLPEEKKLIVFDLDRVFYSRGLLHTLSAFGRKKGESMNIAEAIRKEKIKTIDNIISLYGKEYFPETH